jgi:hypothetical protein
MQKTLTSGNVVDGMAHLDGAGALVAGAADGTALGAWPVRVGGSDGTNIRTLRTDANGTLQIGIDATSSIGASTYRVISAASTNAANIKATPGKIVGFNLLNLAATARYVKFYNKATAPIPGTDSPQETVLVPAGGQVMIDRAFGTLYSVGIGVSINGGALDTDATAVAANDVILELFYF